MSRITLSRRRVGLLVAMALLAAALLSATVARAEIFPEATPERYITSEPGSSLSIVDDEPWPLSDETGTFTLANVNGYGTATNSGLPPLDVDAAHPVDTAETSRCVGDEVRVRVQARAELSTVYKDWVLIKVNAFLYEGTSCNTTDLDGTKSMSFWIPANTSRGQAMTVHNDDEGGDYATITLKMTNRLAFYFPTP
jgi:hypothetical protein